MAGAAKRMQMQVQQIARQNTFENFNSDRLIEVLELLIKDAGRKMFLILDNLRVHHSKLVQAWLKNNKEKIECFICLAQSGIESRRGWIQT